MSPIYPCTNGGPEDDELPVSLPVIGTSAMDHGDVTRFLESSRSPKKILKAAEGRRSTSKPRVKKFPGSKNLAKEAKSKKKKGPFGEAYTPVKATAKGERVKESRGPLGQIVRESAGGAVGRFAEAVLNSPGKLKTLLSSFRRSNYFTEARFFEKAPAGWEGTVKKMKKHKDIDNPWALAHYMKNQGFQSHESDDSEMDRSDSGLTA